MRTKYFVLVSIFYLQTTMSDRLKNAFRRRYFPATLSYRRQLVSPGPPPRITPKGLPKSPPPILLPPGFTNLPPGATFPPGMSNLPPGITMPPDMIMMEEPSTVWAPEPAYRVNLTEQCDYIAHYCLKAYSTGEVCGRTILYNYLTFKNYCMLDYVNCMRQFDAWMLLHMGPCFNITFPSNYMAPDRGGMDLSNELVKNIILSRVAGLQIDKMNTDDY